MVFSNMKGVFAPADLEIIQRVFDQLCQERRLALKDVEQRQRLAREVIEAFQSGLTDATQLWRSLSKLRTAKG